MIKAIGLMETAFRILSEKSAYIPPRVVMTTPDDSMSIFFKPAFLKRYNRMSVKILTQIIANENPEIPTIKGMVMLLDMLNGVVLSIADGTSITALRTGAASGIATSLLANPDAGSVALFGCGAQGRTQLEAVMAVRQVEKIYLFDLSDGQAASLANDIRLRYSAGCEINPGLGILKNTDIICTATPSRKPLFGVQHLKPGTHINAVGSYRPDMQELDPELFKTALTFLDDAPACIADSGDLLNPLHSGIILESDIKGELGQLISGAVSGRQNHDDITVFKSVGNAIQDFIIANEAYDISRSLETIQSINLNS